MQVKKLKKINFLAFSLLLMIALSMVNSQVNSVSPIHFQEKTTANPTLQIYTYQSLMSDAYYNIAGNFTAYSGINVNITRFSDANELVTQLVSGGSKADLIIGIDNALINLINVSDYFVQYDNTSVLNNINSNLINNLDPGHYLIPYDYGVIALTYQNQLINSSNYPFLNNFTFNDLLNSNLASKIIVEDPQISSTGLGFLLSTIATYGDNNTNITGLLGKDWRPFWKQLNNKFTVTGSWNDALTSFLNPKAQLPVMVSYLTDPAYNYCRYNDTSTSSAITTLSNGSKTGWFQVEGLGVVKNSPNQVAAKKFMDWFLSKDLQDQIPESQWMYPSNTQAIIPACFSESGIPNPNTIIPLNNYLTTGNLKSYLNNWLDEWQQIRVTKNLPGFEIITLSFIFPILAIIVILRKKNKE